MKKLIYFCIILSMNWSFFLSSAGGAAVAVNQQEDVDMLKHVTDNVQERIDRLSRYTIPMLKRNAIFFKQNNEHYQPESIDLIFSIKDIVAELNVNMSQLILIEGNIVDKKDSLVERIESLYKLLFVSVLSKHNAKLRQDTYYMRLNPELENSDPRDIVEVLASIITMWDMFMGCFPEMEGNHVYLDISPFSTSKQWSVSQWMAMARASGFHTDNEFSDQIKEYFKALEYENRSSMHHGMNVIGFISKYNIPTFFAEPLSPLEKDYVNVRSHLYGEQYSPDWGSMGTDVMHYVQNSSFGQWLSGKYNAIRKALYTPASSTSATQVELNTQAPMTNNVLSNSGGEIANLDDETSGQFVNQLYK